MKNKTISELLNLHPSDTRVFVFDIDSTLYDVTPRNQQIVRHFAENKNLKDSVLKSSLINFNSDRKDWGIKPGLMRLNSKSIDENIIHAIKHHWNTHFFSKDFLHLDEAYPGAVEFLQALDQISPVYYLTGRDVDRMGEGSQEQLLRSKFPLDSKRNKLILKPDKAILDHTYKVEELKNLQKQFDEIHFFENEPVILNAVHDQAPDIHLYYIDSVNSGRAKIYQNIKTLKPNYSRD